MRFRGRVDVPLAAVGLTCALVGMVVLLLGDGRGTASAGLATDQLLGSMLVAVAVLALSAVALLRAGRR